MTDPIARKFEQPAGQAGEVSGLLNPREISPILAAEAVDTMQGGKPAAQAAGPKGRFYDGVGNQDAFRWFCELDEDDSGGLDFDEFFQLVKKLGLKNGKKQMKKIFGSLDPLEKGFLTFPEFAEWFNAFLEKQRRTVTRAVKEIFNKIDKEGSGFLNKEQFGLLAEKAKLQLDPPFDLDSDWKRCKTNKALGDKSEELVLKFGGFEAWWKERLGIDEPDIPVLPEYMVQKIDEASLLGRRRAEREQALHGRRSGKILWEMLRPRLFSLVRMQRQWGDLHDLYEAVHESRHDVLPLPAWIRDPDSDFSTAWDLTQVVLLLFVTVTVPLRAGFDVDVELWSAAFFIDMAIDIYFVRVM